MTDRPSVDADADDARVLLVRFGKGSLGDVGLALGDLLAHLGDDAAVIVDLTDTTAESGDDGVGAIVDAFRAATSRGMVIVIAASDEMVRMELNRRDVDRIAPVRFGLDDARVILNRMISI